MTASERLRTAIQKHAPKDHPDGQVRAFQRALRPHSSRVASSMNYVRRYVSGEFEPPASFLEAAVKALPGVDRDWLVHGKGDPGAAARRRKESARVAAGPHPHELVESYEAEATAKPDSGTDESSEDATPSEEPESVPEPPAEDALSDIRDVVTRAGPQPEDSALDKLDGRGADTLSRRNWSILYDAVVGGKNPKEIAAEIKLSASRIRAIRDEYAGLVREAVGGGGEE